MAIMKSCIAIRGEKYSLELIKSFKKWVLIVGMCFARKK